MSIMGGLPRTAPSRKKERELGKSRYHTRGIRVSQTARHLASGKQKIASGKVLEKNTRDVLDGSTVEDISLNPRSNCNSVSLHRPERPNWDCGGGVERALWQDTETDASAVTSSALFIQLTGRLILYLLLLSLSKERLSKSTSAETSLVN